jgi:pyruvate dehydrogenase E2 component (dihydrolipoamide acetyltransferase)
MEVPAQAAGVISEVLVKIGDRVSQGTVLARIGAPASASVVAGAPAVPPPPPPAAPTGTAPASPPALAAIVAPAPPAKNGSSNGASSGVAAGPLHASPAIRRFARELGVNLSGVAGSGPNGRITRDDVQHYVKNALANPAAAPAPTPAASGAGLQLLPWPNIDFEKFGPIERTPLSRIAKISGQNLARNWVLIPHVTQHEDADVTDLEAFRKTINAEHKDVKVTMLALLMKALIATLRAYPRFNSSLAGDDLILKRYYHLGFAADTPNGLVVPVIRDVDRKGVLEIAAETSVLAKKARDGKLGPADMTGAGFTISSLGGIGGTAFTPIINAPEVAILGVSRTATKPVWDGTSFVPRLLLPLSLSYDHRVIDGAAAARFITHLAGVLADMRKTLL